MEIFFYRWKQFYWEFRTKSKVSVASLLRFWSFSMVGWCSRLLLHEWWIQRAYILVLVLLIGIWRSLFTERVVFFGCIEYQWNQSSSHKWMYQWQKKDMSYNNADDSRTDSFTGNGMIAANSSRHNSLKQKKIQWKQMRETNVAATFVAYSMMITCL